MPTFFKREQTTIDDGMDLRLRPKAEKNCMQAAPRDIQGEGEKGNGVGIDHEDEGGLALEIATVQQDAATIVKA